MASRARSLIRSTILLPAFLLLDPTVVFPQDRPAAPPSDTLAAPGRAGWSIEARTGCWVWNPDGAMGTKVAWSGGCGPDGRASGQGIAEWRSGALVARNEGEYRNGKLNGRGTWTGLRGERYEGEYRDGKGHGQGIAVSPDGNRYEGQWGDGRPNGRGIETLRNGDRYDGEWRNGRKDGRGVLTTRNGDRYDGEWRDGLANGFGELWMDGRRFAGTWKDGCFRDGQGNRFAVGRPLSGCP